MFRVHRESTPELVADGQNFWRGQVASETELGSRVAAAPVVFGFSGFRGELPGSHFSGAVALVALGYNRTPQTANRKPNNQKPVFPWLHLYVPPPDGLVQQP